MSQRFRFSPALPATASLTLGDALVFFSLAALLYLGAHLAFHAPAIVRGPEISLQPEALPWYALFSVGRMTVAYLLSLAFSLAYGYGAAHDRRAEKVLMPLLDVLQSVPILSFLPVVLLGLSALLPEGFAAEVAAIVLIFTSQAWNMTFSVYQSLSTVPVELREAAAVFRFGRWMTFTTLELPFSALGLVWNSMMSWAGGWFFLMAAEMFTVGSRDFRLPGLGSYLHSAADAGDVHAVLLGVATLIVVIVLLDQFLWRPLLAWGNRFKIEAVEGQTEPRSWFREALARSWLLAWVRRRLWVPVLEKLMIVLQSGDRLVRPPMENPSRDRWSWRQLVAISTVAAPAVWYGHRALVMILTLQGSIWLAILEGLLATLLRVALSLAIALGWTLPVGVAIGTQPRLARVLQPVAQVAASVPATALFPILLLALLHVPGGLNLSAVLLMLLGTQWYLLFNVIAGAAAIPQDLRDTAALLGLSRTERWRILFLPALFPYLVTGAITAGGGAWNASIVAEYVQFGGQTHATTGLGALIAQASAQGNYALLLAATLTMVVAVVLINRTFWVRLYRVAEHRYRME
jgi:NitT/TauT family transport system permease protein